MSKSKAGLQHQVIMLILGEHASKKGKSKEKDEPEEIDDLAEEAKEKKSAKARKVVR